MSRVYDLVMTHKLDTDDFFIHRVQQRCGELGLNFFLIEPLFVERFFQAYTKHELWAKVLLNMHSEHHLPDDPYNRLVWAAHRRNTKVIDPPDLAEAAFDKARMHHKLLEAGFNVPYTITVTVEQTASFKLTAEQAEGLGSPFVIKPSHGYGRKGVILDAENEQDLARSVAAWRNSAYLLQRLIQPLRVAEVPVYFRAFYVFGQVWICWWNCFTDHYSKVTEKDRAEYNLPELEDMIIRVAQLSRMNFFSSEIALTQNREFVLIDYVNDQCHMLSQSADPKIGVPDTIVASIAHRLVDAAAQMIGIVKVVRSAHNGVTPPVGEQFRKPAFALNPAHGTADYHTDSSTGAMPGILGDVQALAGSGR
jgi:hypothetical protein